MPYLKQIVNYINTSLKTTAFKGALKDAQVNGIAITTPKSAKDNKVEYLPCVFDNHFDDGEYVGIDDRFPLQLYHKNNGFAQGAPVLGQVGDGNLIQRRVINMAMIVFAKRVEAGVTPESLFDMIDSNLPDTLDAATLDGLTGLQTVDIRISSANFNALQIIQSEYKLEKMSIAPSSIFFQINYIVECVFKRGCIITCCN